MSKSVAFHTLGCKLNFAETSTIAKDFDTAGFVTVPYAEKADVYVINTCSVTENADRECRNIVGRALRANPDGFIVVVGCYAQLKPEQIMEMPGVDLVLGATEKFNVTQFLGALEKQQGPAEIHSCEIAEANSFVSSYSAGERTRAFLKVQDGCDYKCTYCTIPLARGISRSDTLENVVKNAKEIAAKGIPEIVLTGVNVGDYGKGEFGNKRHENTFLELVQALDEQVPVDRIRISSIEPNLLRDEIIAFTGTSKKFVPHFHIPLQSGSDEILKKMKRRYMTALYRKRVAAIRKAHPDAGIGVDVIVGFPGETEAHFLETYNFINSLEISYLHVFTYSERSNTSAAAMDGIVPIPERKRRNKMLRILSEKKTRQFYENQLGQSRPVLFEGENRKGYMYGYTDNYIRVKTFWNPEWANKIKTFSLSTINNDGIVILDVPKNAINATNFHRI
ncbi:tRNA (N(6)-L-threonylcarbamoyladenosine(37)-C(2))-methylthiotransferase MtaB [Schleiferiaceae bacterium]|nr:tRNA (N(6)-L-threonylcarbamoyladenosine(37)-C(2))-methylthiotransferase MtaB [Schleiferiaceae bacterium]MDA8661282.1 tRNA (N(6)-L-threonylcarbamoyladenosine(37)-C(2))-methylthiotransferase MtaB [Schleiferiaceae bacterium]